MRLRQVALASTNLDAVTAAFAEVFGLKVAYNDPHIDHYGLKNAVISAGTGFLEVVEPIADNASAGRFLNRRGGDAGYMLIIQVADAGAEIDRVKGLGVRVVDEIDRKDYKAAHFHPADFGGVLASFDQQRSEADFLKPYGDWMPAGADWRDTRTDEVLDLTAVTLTHPDPDALARRYAELLGRPLDAANPRRLPMDHGEMLFAVSDQPVTSVAGVTLKVRDPEAALARARAKGIDVNAEGVLIGGMRFKPTA